MVKINIYDCGCVDSRPKEPSCKNYGTRWRAYISLGNDLVPKKLLLKCRDCGRLRHFNLLGQNPVMIEYLEREDDELVHNDI